MKRVTLYLTEEEYQAVRHNAFEEELSMSAYFKKFLTPTVSTSGNSTTPSTPISSSKSPKTSGIIDFSMSKKGKT